MGFSLLAIIFVFGILVIIHELGHFLAAKWMGVRVERFSIGFPPRIFGKKIGDTDYCISAIPLGGYVKMSGMVDESMDTEVTGADYEFASKPVWKRMVIITAGVIMNFFLAVIVLGVLNYSKGKSIIPYTEIGIVGKDGIAQKIGFEVGDKVKAINNMAVNSWQELNEEYINQLGNDIRFDIIRDGNPTQLFFRKEWFSEEKSEQLDIAWMPEAKIGRVIPGMPASDLGLQRGDIILSINNKTVTNWMEMTESIRSHGGDSVAVIWQRDAKKMSGILNPTATDETDSSGAVVKVGKIGIEWYTEKIPMSILGSLSEGFSSTVNMIGLNSRAIWWVITGTKTAKEILGGPIMIAKMAGDAASAGWEQLWYLIAVLSAVLAFFNILPIPALDGGHLVLLIYEAIARKPMSTKVKLAIQQVGLAILLTFIVFVLYIDLKRLLF